MYAQQGYAPKSSRTVGLSGSLLVCAGLMTVMATMLAPKIVPGLGPEEPIKLIDIKKKEPPPRVEEVKKPEPRPELREIYQPRVEVPTKPTEPSPTTTDTMPDVFKPLPDPGIPAGSGGGTAPEPAKPAPLPFVGASVDPRFAGNFQPDYPSSEIRLGREGYVTVRVLVGTDGRVKAVEQVSATSPAFFEATKRRALDKWRFKPATRGGTPEESWKRYSVKFVLNDG